MPWAKLDDDFFAHPKLITAGLDGTGLFARALSYSARYMTDGVVPKRWVLEQVGGDMTLPSRLCDVELWREEDESYVIDAWAEYNTTRAQWEADQAKKSKAGRKGAEARLAGAKADA